MCGEVLKTLTNPVKALKSITGALSPDIPSLPSTPDPSVAAKEAAAVDLERRRKVAKGGKKSTLLAGQKVAQDEQRKTLLGQ